MSAKILLFDAANTLIGKPNLWVNLLDTLANHGYQVVPKELKYNHKILSELIDFPDKTSREFYITFNTELLLSLGIIPDEQLLDAIFQACTYQPWVAFDDVDEIKKIDMKKAVVSNFSHSLNDIINTLIGPEVFEDIIISEQERYRKPQVQFYQLVLDRLGVNAEDILYIGDSLKLDCIPAKSLGIQTLLIDRDGIFKYASRRISHFSEIKNYL